MLIRNATPQDAEKLLAIYAPYVADTAISFEYSVPTAEDFSKRIENTLKTYPYIVAEESGEILGYAYAGVFHAREAYLHCVETSIYVSKACRGKGIGRLLYTELEKLLMKQSVFILYACITAPDEEPDSHVTDDSIRFHERMGYRLCGRHSKCGYKFGAWYSIVWMEKRLIDTPVTPKPFIPFSKL